LLGVECKVMSAAAHATRFTQGDLAQISPDDGAVRESTHQCTGIASSTATEQENPAGGLLDCGDGASQADRTEVAIVGVDLIAALNLGRVLDAVVAHAVAAALRLAW